MPVGIPDLHSPEPGIRQLLDQTACPIFIKRINQTFTYANAAFRALYPGCKIVGRNGQALFGAQRAAAYLREDRTCLAEGQLLTEWRAPDRRKFLVHKVPLQNPSGSALIGATMFDITNFRDQAADALEEMKLLKAESDAKALLLAEAADKIEYVSLHDAHTGLANRRYFERRLKEASAGSDSIAVITIDLDLFKQINDTAGHFAGDHVLQHVACTISRASRLGDFVARVGGDEFTILCDHDGRAGPILDVAAQIQAELDQPVTFRGHSLRVGASIGIAVPEDAGRDPDALLVAADLALYRAKAQGRGQVVLFEPRMQIEARRHERRAAAFENALSKGEMRAHYQAQIRVSTARLVGVEALARWYHPSDGVLTPGSFLDIAEKTGRLAELDAAILKDAGRVFAKLHQARTDVPKLSANISAEGLTREGLLDDIDALGLPRGALSIELIETILFDGAEAEWRQPIDALKARGVGVEIDDFGTGRASIVSLSSVAPDVMKLDRQFVTDLPDSAEARQIVAAMIDIGRTLGIEVLAEGVETAAQARILTELGCDLLQGWLFGQPVSEEELVDLIEKPSGHWRDLLGDALQAVPRTASIPLAG
ncbi:putative bifunctional diguanylate cyclase/phosphodiesterase [Pontivivens insulae]|uniref:Putative signaling protein n=1 Tax=Pontivivens insulae TaxID=1639689 RepID=A0A2R8AB32_9RHOB|nr:EAL domain-containing protein [Pontivivens insulae]RED13168.1 diguanylate cyclase (GGDEF)-like protein [Pontivivens insulae]SPF29260.1 putative signaling protein [Pontivivens insulae]